MVQVNMNDGTTLTFDFTKETDAHAWKRFVSGHGWADSVRGLAICHNGVRHALPIPKLKRFRCYGFGAELVKDRKTGKPCAERVYYHFNKMRIGYLIYLNEQPVTKVEVIDVSNGKKR